MVVPAAHPVPAGLAQYRAMTPRSNQPPTASSAPRSVLLKAMAVRGGPIADPHTRVLRRLLLDGVRRFRTTRAEDISPAWDRPGRKLATVRAPDLGSGGVDVVAEDEDSPVRPVWLRWLVQAAHRLPVVDRPEGWVSPLDCSRAQTDAFGELLPTPHVAWGDPTGPDALARFVRAGLGAHRLEASGDGYALDADRWADLPVRPGFAPYGGRVELDAAGRFRSLRRGGVAVAPGDSGFDAAAFAFRASVLLGVTVVDHLGAAHYGISNALLHAARTQLRFDHPLRAFLRPFLFRTATINHGALQTLVPRGGLVHRASGLTWDGAAALYSTMLQGCRYEPLPERAAALGEPGDAAPFFFDGAEWYAGLRGFVADALDSSEAGSWIGGRWRDETLAFWAALRTGIADLPAPDRDGLEQGLTWLVHSVTAQHAHVGHVAPWVRDPSGAAGRVWRGSAQADQQNSLQLSTVAILTGLPMPGITGRWDHGNPDRGVRAAAGRFRDWLAGFQERVDGRNAERDQAVSAFSPRAILCSASR